MALETKLVQKLSQSLLMTPQLQQAIKLLQLGRLEYIEAIEKELLENPILEEIKEDHDGERHQDQDMSSVNHENFSNGAEYEKSVEQNSSNPIDWEDYLESLSDPRGAASPKGLIDFDNRPSLDSIADTSEDLQSHLLSQLRFIDADLLQKGILLQFIGNLDKNGYLCISYEEIAEECNCTLEEVQSAADLLHSLDPVGVGARDMKECLLIQLEHKGLSGGLTEKIIKLHLSKLENRKYDLIAKEEGVELKDVYTSVTTIQSLDPRPARQFTEDATRYIVPDIYISKVGKEYVITLNDDGMPRLVVSPYYLELLKKKDETSKEQRNYLNEKLKAASWLIKSIYQRQQTIYKVTESIVKYQREFLEYGIDRLKPLVLKEVANDIGMHESTVSRVTTNKYVHTPQGVFELKYFFTSGIKTAEGDISSSSIKEKIKSLIAAEDPAKPLSDQQIVETFQAENVTIARRTVAKYRESLGILSSSRRKKLF